MQSRGLACVLPLVLLAAPAAAREQGGARASRAFNEGQKLFDGADYIGAIEAFKRAYSLRPHFLVLCNIALCHERRNNMVEASQFYQRCLDQGAGRTDKAAAVRNSLTRVQQRVTWIEVRSRDRGGTIHVDGRAVGSTPKRIPVDPGSHVVEVQRPGAKTVSANVATRGGETLTLELTPVQLAVPPPRRSHRPPVRRRGLHQAWFWATAGLSVALAVAGTVTGVQTLRIRDEYEASPTRELLDRGTSRRLVTNLLWAAAAASAGTAATLFFFTDFRRHETGGATTVGLALQGRFWSW